MAMIASLLLLMVLGYLVVLCCAEVLWWCRERFSARQARVPVRIESSRR
jgi:hypothetical protein